MKRFNKYVSILLVITLMIGLIPPMTSNASGTPAIEILGLYSPDASGYVNNDVSTQPADLNLVTRLTSQKITLNGSYYNFDPVQVENFYYTVTSVKPDGTRTTVKYDNNSPVITSKNTFEFRNVVLNEGLNKIVVYSVNGDTSSKAAWVYYYPVVTITDLQVNQEPFVDGMIVPSDPLSTGTGLIVTGTAPNADSVTIQTLGDSTPYSGYYNSQTGYFQFKIDSINSTKLADFKIAGGDQKFDIVASNGTQKMTLTRSFVYNDGSPFTFGNKIASSKSDTLLNDLITQPVINGTTNEVYLKGNFKVDVDPNNPSELLYDSATVQIEGGESVRFNFGNDPTTDSPDATIVQDMNKSTDKYKVYNYEIENMNINSGKKKQTIITKYEKNSLIYTTPIYYFDYINTNLPYISDLKFADSNISVINGTQINELPIKLRVVPDSTNAKFSDVNIYYDNNIPLPNANKTAESYTATASQKIFNLQNGYTVGNGSLAVLVNGNLKVIGTDYSETNSTTVTFQDGVINAGDIVTFLFGANTVFESYTATASQQDFNVETGYEKGNIKVYKNNTLQTLDADYSELNNKTIRFNNPLTAGDKVTFVYDTNKVVENYRASSGQKLVNLKTSYTLGNGSLNVYKNGVLQTKNIHYTEKSDKSIEFINALATNDLITVTYDDIFLISWLPEGTHNLTFVPIDSNGDEKPIGGITRSINYIPMQYIIVNNIYNGQIFDNYNDITEIQGRLVNVPSTNAIKGYVGDKSINISRNADNTFTADVSNKLTEGRNVITFKIVDKNNEIVSESMWEIYIFTTKIPGLSLDIDPKVQDLFITTNELKEGQYSTKEKKVKFKGAFSEASSINVHIYRKDENGKPITKEGVWSYPDFSNSAFNISQDSMIINKQDNFGSGTANGTFELIVDLASLGTTTIVVQATNASGIISSRTYEITREPLTYEIIYPNLDRTNVVNSNYVRIEMLAEGADLVKFKDGTARKDTIYDRQGYPVEGFVYEVYNLKPGKNKIKFTVYRGDQKTDAEIEIINANTNIQGATYKTKIDKSMKAFGGLVQLDFPKGTMLKRNDDSTINPYLSSERQILFGIAEDTYGRVDKYRHPLTIELQKDYDVDGNIIDNHYPAINKDANIGKNYLTEPTNRFIPASELIWIDAGTLKENASDKEDILYGGGMLPYDSDDIFYDRNNADQIVPTNRGTITLKYNSNIRADAWPYLTIYQFTYNPDKSIYEWKNIGGVVDTKKQTITAPIDSFGYFRVMYMNQSFDDVVGHSWARVDLDTLYSKGIMVNKFEDRFVPEENITRGEFVTLLVKAFELPLDYEGQGTFYDVFKDPVFIGNPLYEYKYIETAARYGIVRGQFEGTFAPNENITRQDAAVMIARAANLKTSSVTDEKQVARTKASLQKQFTDANLIDLYAAPSVEAVVKAGLMTGKPNVLLEGQTKTTYRFDPTFELKRSEAARIVMNVMKQQKKIPK